MIKANQYRLQDVANILEVEEKLLFPDRIIDQLLTDSRRLKDPVNTLFFCLSGKKESQQFIAELYHAGVRCFVIPFQGSDLTLETINTRGKDLCLEADFLEVHNPLKALQELARYHRNQFKYPVIGITGSNGKTIVKEWLNQLLSFDEYIIRSPKSYNSQIGVPLSVWEMKNEYTLGIFEAGISQGGEMAILEKIIQPDIGILTNIGTAHDEGFSNGEEKIVEKLSLFKNSKTLIYSPDYIKTEYLNENQEFKDLAFFTWSMQVPADLEVVDLQILPFNTEIKGKYLGKVIRIEIPFTDRASIENAVICWATLLHLRYPQHIITERMLGLYSLGMRMELKQGTNDCTIINDSYSLDLPSLEIALDFLNQQNQFQKKTVIISDILQTGKSGIALYTELNLLLQAKGIDRMVGIGENLFRFQNLFTLVKTFYTSTSQFLETYLAKDFHNEAILIKGARVFEFEKITRVFEKKIHETILEINLNALIYNYNYYRRKLNPKTKIMVMVKAFSYGMGSFELASALQYHGVDYLSVAYVDEGVSLRNSGIKTPILVLNPDESGFPSLVHYNLEAEVYSFRILLALTDFLHKQGDIKHSVHLKIDTGMHRLGFNPEEVELLIAFLKENPQIIVKGIFSHLTSSEDEKDDPFTLSQMDLFESLARKIQQGIGYQALCHIANSAAASRFPRAQMDMVRLGIGLYGISIPTEKKFIQTVACLKTTISQVRHLKKGDSIGYNRAGVLHRDSTIATVKIGYADGYRREFGNGKGKMLVRGQLAPVAGKVCMDMTMIDITDTGGEELEEVIIFNDEMLLEDLASDIGTISYELLSGISARVKRVYYYE